MRLPKGLGMPLLAVWLIGTGLFALVPRLGFHGLPEIWALLALAAGVLILMDL